jgi:hypothetical protein
MDSKLEKRGSLKSSWLDSWPDGRCQVIQPRRWIERTQRVNLNDLVERMSTQELDDYARDGALPKWFDATVGATTGDGQ